MEAISSNDVFTFSNFHVAAQAQGMPPSTRSKEKMKYQYYKELARATPSLVTTILDNASDTEIGHVDMTDFLQKGRSSC